MITTMIVILGRVGAVKKSNIWTRTRTKTLFALGTRQAMETEKNENTDVLGKYLFTFAFWLTTSNGLREA